MAEPVATSRQRTGRAEIYDCMHSRKDYSAEAALVVSLLGRLPARCLDVGCGTGVHAHALAALGVTEVVGVDPDPTAIEWARGRDQPPNARLRFEVGDISASGAGPFDLVTLLFNVVNYVLSEEDLAAVFAHAAALSPSLTAFDAWAPRYEDQADTTTSIRTFECNGGTYSVETQLRFAPGAPDRCRMIRTVVALEHPDEEVVIEDVALRVWAPAQLAEAAAEAGFDVTATTWEREFGDLGAPGPLDRGLFLCRL